MVAMGTRSTFVPVALPLPFRLPIRLLAFSRAGTFNLLLLDVSSSISQVAIYRRARGIVELEQLATAALSQASTFRRRSKEGAKNGSLWWIGARDIQVRGTAAATTT